MAEVRPLLRYIRAAVIAKFGDTQDSSKTLEDFGFTPRKSRPKDVAVKAEAAQEVRATRDARGTKGKKQKAKIKGTAKAAPAPAASTAPAQIKAPT